MIECEEMLGTAYFYKSTPKIMPKHLQTKRSLTAVASPVSKKRRTGIVGKEASNSNKVTSSIKSENGLQPRRASARISSAKTSSDIKKEAVKIKEEVKKNEDEEDEEEEEAASPSNGISGDEDSDESNGEMSAYEKKRLQNIQENAKFFASLGISKTKENLSESSGVKTTKGLKREVRKKEVLPRRPLSLRLRRMDPEGIALPPLPELSAPFYAENLHVRKPSGTFDMEPINLSEDSGENLASRLFKSITRLSKSPNKSPKKEALQPDLAAFTKTMQSLRLEPEHVAKVTKDRIFSVAIHPSPTKILACAGDKWGKIGVWDVESQDGNDGVYLFEPHSRPVSCLQFAPGNPAKLYSSSYDGTLRCGDFERGMFDEIHSTDVDEEIFCSHFDFLSPDGAKLLVGQNQSRGYVQVVDSRLKSATKTGSWLHDRYVKTVHVHPTKPEYFVTGSSDNSVALWDLRTLKEHGKNKHVSSVTHGRAVSAAYFSPVTGSKVVTTSYDDRIRILQVEENGNMEVQKAVRHDNHTGRWLTTFRANWHPRREDVIVVGSMERPRRIHLFDDQGHLLHNLLGDDLASVCSVNAFHRTRDVVVGANSSGRLHVFM